LASRFEANFRCPSGADYSNPIPGLWQNQNYQSCHLVLHFGVRQLYCYVKKEESHNLEEVALWPSLEYFANNRLTLELARPKVQR
jgi:hypothetical protein